jgi:hypothetical protein
LRAALCFITHPRIFGRIEPDQSKQIYPARQFFPNMQSPSSLKNQPFAKAPETIGKVDLVARDYVLNSWAENSSNPRQTPK